MNAKQIIHAIQENYYTIGVTFDNTGKLYTYKVNSDIKLEQYDSIIVKVHDKFNIGCVQEIHATPQIDFNSNLDYKWIVQKVDDGPYNKQVEKEALAMIEIKRAEHRERAKQAKDFIKSNIGEDVLNSIRNRLEAPINNQ